MNTPDTPTPRTTEQVFSYPIMVEISDGDWEERQGLAVPADFARQLKRELTAAKEELEIMRVASLDSGTFWAECLRDALRDKDTQLSARDAELALLRTESLEQARLLGMSGEREADLRGEIERLRRRVEAADGLAVYAAKVTNWFTGASRRSFDQEMVNRGRFDSLADANNHDGRNFGKMASDGDKALAAYRATEGKK